MTVMSMKGYWSSPDMAVEVHRQKKGTDLYHQTTGISVGQRK